MSLPARNWNSVRQGQESGCSWLGKQNQAEEGMVINQGGWVGGRTEQQKGEDVAFVKIQAEECIVEG